MIMNKPIKRHEALKELSKDHHHGLMLSWKIRAGFKNNVEPKRIMDYVNWFWKDYLEEHFEIEEEVVFPVLGDDHELVKKALSEHRKIRRILKEDGNLVKRLIAIEEKLEKHIRFEERVLFNEIQNVANVDELKAIQDKHSSQIFKENSSDLFWKN